MEKREQENDKANRREKYSQKWINVRKLTSFPARNNQLVTRELITSVTSICLSKATHLTGRLAAYPQSWDALAWAVGGALGKRHSVELLKAVQYDSY